MQDSAITLILLLVILGSGLFYYNIKKTGKGFAGSLILSGFTTLVFALFFIGGLFLFFNNAPPGEILPGLQMWTIRVFGCGLALFAMFGLLIARGLAVLISIEHAAHTLATGPDATPNPQDGPSTVYRVGQVIGRAIRGGEGASRGRNGDET